MNNNLLAWLLSTGLDDQRAELYLAALSMGEASAKDLAEATKLGRTAVYDNLRVLEERGYIQTLYQGKRKVFIPLHPKELYKKFDQQKEQLKDLLPDFLSVYAEKGKTPFVQLFTGPNAAREIYEDIIKSGAKEYVYFTDPQFAFQMVDRKYIEKWIRRRVEKKVKSRSLRVQSKRKTGVSVFDEEEKYLRKIRSLPTYVDLKSSIYIYGNNIGVISTQKEGVAFIIYSKDMAFSLTQLFEFMWGISK